MENKTENSLIEFDGANYPIKFQQAKVDFAGYNAMKSKIDELHESLEGYVVTPDNYQDAKAKRSELNRLRKAINDRKIAIVKTADEPIIIFKKQVKTINNEIDDSSNMLNVQIKAFDDKLKQDKHNRNLERITKLAKISGVDAEKIIYSPKWDNKSFSNTTFEQEVGQQIDVLVEHQKQYVENVKVVAKSAQKLGLPSKHWIEELQIKQLSMVLQEMEDYAKQINKIAQHEAENKKKERANLEKHGDKLIDKRTGEVKDKIYKMVLVIEGTKYQLQQLARYTKDMGITAKRVKKGR